MNIQEIRVGNFCKRVHPYNDYGRILIISPSVYLSIKDGTCWNYLNQISPIPLTPEILIKCGFESGEKNIWFLGFRENFCIEYAEYLMEFNYYLFGYNYTQTQIKYLHQLQNLYFSLTGKELEINL